MKKKFYLFLILVIPLPMTFTAVFAGSGTANVTVTGGALTLVSFPSTLNFSNYAIGLAGASSNLTDDFDLVLEDFRGTQAGWKLNVLIEELVNGDGDPLHLPDLNADLSTVSIFNSDATGAAGSAETDLGAFTLTGGDIDFGVAHKFIPAEMDNENTAGRHHFNFPDDSLTLGFSNLTNAGSYTGVTTFALETGP